MKHIIVIISAASFLAACSGGSSSGDNTSTTTPTTPVNTAPDVEAGTDQSVTEGTTVQLDASVTDAQGDNIELA